VHFKDMQLALDSESEEDVPVGVDATTPRTQARRKRVLVEKNKLIIIMVGLPGRGKTFLSNKLRSYLRWLGHPTEHFNVGTYRRQIRTVDGKPQDAAFFDASNAAGVEARTRALNAAIADVVAWLALPNSQVAIFDATNSTRERRDEVRYNFHGKFQYIFIESICNEPAVLELNYRYKMLYSPDYAGADMEEAMADFGARIRKYEEVYVPIDDDTTHYIKLINMVTGQGKVVLNRVSGYLPGKIVTFLLQVCKDGLAKPRKLWLSRHGESNYNVHGRIGGDSRLSPLGEKYAERLVDLLITRVPVALDGRSLPVSVWTSTLQRTIQTAELLPFPKLRWKALDEIQAGAMEGLTYDEINRAHPAEFAARKASKLTYRYPRGESYLDLIQRLEPVVIEVERERECVCIVAHQAVLRVIYGYLTNQDPIKIPELDLPLHTLIELTPKPDGTMYEERFPVDVHAPAPSVADILAMGSGGQVPIESHQPDDSTPDDSRHGAESSGADAAQSRDAGGEICPATSSGLDSAGRSQHQEQKRCHACDEGGPSSSISELRNSPTTSAGPLVSKPVAIVRPVPDTPISPIGVVDGISDSPVGSGGALGSVAGSLSRLVSQISVGVGLSMAVAAPPVVAHEGRTSSQSGYGVPPPHPGPTSGLAPSAASRQVKTSASVASGATRVGVSKSTMDLSRLLPPPEMLAASGLVSGDGPGAMNRVASASTRAGDLTDALKSQGSADASVSGRIEVGAPLSHPPPAHCGRMASDLPFDGNPRHPDHPGNWTPPARSEATASDAGGVGSEASDRADGPAVILGRRGRAADSHALAAGASRISGHREPQEARHTKEDYFGVRVVENATPREGET